MAFTGRFVVNIAHFASKQGADLGELIAMSGETAATLCEESHMIEDAVYNAIVERAVELTKDEFFGLHAGENLSLAAAGLIAQISQTSETVKQALELCCEFANLGCSALPMQLEEEKDHYKVSMVPNELWRQQSPLAVKHTADGVIAFSIREFHSLTRMKHYPIAVHMSWPQPSNVAEYERVFGCPVRFNQDGIAILFRREHVEEKVVTADYNLLRILVAHAGEKTSQMQHDRGFVAMVKQSVVGLVKPEFPTIEQVAGHLNVSSRTLQRRLKEEGFTYKQLIDELRQEFALGYLKRADLSVGEIAYLLSYADTSAFTRSFKRWTGKTPVEYRRNK